MDIVFSKVSDDDREIFDERPLPIGFIMMESAEGGAWEMRRSPSGNDTEGYRDSGTGEVRGIRPASSWINSLSFQDSQSVFNHAGQGWSVRSGVWFGLEVDEILKEWKLDEIAIDKAADFMATICARISGITYDMCLLSDKKTAAKATREMYRASSLATGLLSFNEAGVMRSVPSSKEMEEHLRQTLQNGIPWVAGKVPEDEIRLEFRFPRVTYAMKALDCTVPLSGEWNRAMIPEDMDANVFVSQIIEKFGKHTLFRAVYDLDSMSQPAWSQAIIGSYKGTDRTRFTGGEMETFCEPHYTRRVSSAMVPEKGCTKSSTMDLLDLIVESFGGLTAAQMSWSVGLFVENALMSAFRSGKTRRSSVSGEGVWVAAQDRILMYPLIRALSECGATILKARNGRVLVSVPRAPENIMNLTYAAWELGAHLGYRDAVQIAASMQVELPTDRESWPGDDTDHMIASLNHNRSKKELWSLDGLTRLESKERPAHAANILASWTK